MFSIFIAYAVSSLKAKSPQSQDLFKQSITTAYGTHQPSIFQIIMCCDVRCGEGGVRGGHGRGGPGAARQHPEQPRGLHGPRPHQPPPQLLQRQLPAQPRQRRPRHAPGRGHRQRGGVPGPRHRGRGAAAGQLARGSAEPPGGAPQAGGQAAPQPRRHQAQEAAAAGGGEARHSTCVDTTPCQQCVSVYVSCIYSREARTTSLLVFGRLIRSKLPCHYSHIHTRHKFKFNCM